MFYKLLSHPDIGQYISIFITICFVVAFCLAYKNWRSNPSVFITSAILFLNFAVANNALYEFLAATEPDYENYYLNWVGYNALSIVAIITIHLLARIKHDKISVVAMYLLLINVIMYMAMHIDIIIQGNRQPWLLWSLYGPTVNLSEISTAILLSIYSAYAIHIGNTKTARMT